MTDLLLFTIVLTYIISDLLCTLKQKVDHIKQQIGQKIGKMLGMCFFPILFTQYFLFLHRFCQNLTELTRILIPTESAGIPEFQRNLSEFPRIDWNLHRFTIKGIILSLGTTYIRSLHHFRSFSLTYLLINLI